MIKKGVQALLLFTVVLHAADDQKTVITLEPEDVLSTERKVGWTDFVTLGASLSWRQIFGLQKKQSELKQEFKSLRRSTSGGKGNAFHALSPVMKQKHGLDISDCQEELLKRSVNPVKRDELIELIRTLREKGYIVLAATDQDFAHHMIYREKMAALEFEWNDHFQGSIVAEFHNFKEGEKKEAADGVIEQEPGVFMIDGPHQKTDRHYWAAVAAVAQRQLRHTPAFRGIHIDPDETVVTAVNGQSQFQGIHFKNHQELQDALQEQRILDEE